MVRPFLLFLFSNQLLLHFLVFGTFLIYRTIGNK